MYVDFISDEHYKNCVRHVLDSFKKASELKESVETAIKAGDIFKSSLFSNKIDPFKMAFEIGKISMKEWVKKEILRQLDKSVEQKIGEFHQMVLGGVKGWNDLKVGQVVDLVNDDKTIYIEVKNKFNTCNGGKLNKLREELEDITKNNHKATAYWAYIIASTVDKSGEEIWVKEKYNRITAVKKAWGEKVYEIVTGNKSGLEKIYKTLPLVIKDVLSKEDEVNVSTIIDEIVELLDNHLSKIQDQIYANVFKN